ncbi:hypothetical protein BDZ89DRAFT_769777 [Hymenopellis radicata]|nr:hypothetical protein BDZ89DRAFT_769777 [Hymenopellis radicata]
MIIKSTGVRMRFRVSVFFFFLLDKKKTFYMWSYLGCSRGSYSVVAPQKLDLPRPRECAFNPNVRFAKPNPRRAQPPAEADHDPPLQLDHHQLDNDRVAEQPIVKRDPYEEDDRHQLELRPAANIESERPPPDVPPEAPTTSRWQPYETPLENRARVGSRAPEHDVFSSRVQRTDVKPEPMDVDLPPSTHQTEVVVKDEEPENRDNSPEAGSAGQCASNWPC